MNQYEWKDEYEIGIKEIDDQHKKWLGILNHLHIAFKNNQHLDVMENTLNELFEYTQYHFKSEEELFLRSNYYNKEEHIRLHSTFVKKLQKLSCGNKAGRSTLTYQLMSVLQNWLIDHIQWEDKQYVPYLK